MITCNQCGSSFVNKRSFDVHKSRNQKEPIWKCKEKLDKKRVRAEASTIIESYDPESILKIAKQAETQEQTNVLLKQLTAQVTKLEERNAEQSQQMEKLSQQNNELKDMMIDIQNNPKLVLVCNQLYPINTLREINLLEPRFEPVRQILDKELPEYANLANDPTAQVHCKAVKQLNIVHPTAVKDGDQIFYKNTDILSKDVNHETTKAFIEAIANSGYEYAQKAKKDLSMTLESDVEFKKQVLENASRDSIPNVTEIN